MADAAFWLMALLTVASAVVVVHHDKLLYSAIALLFSGLTLATVLGLPFGTWLGQEFGWRATFWVVSGIGIVAALAIAALLPRTEPGAPMTWRDLAGFARPGPLRALAMTVLGYAGVFMVFTFITPVLTEVAGIAEAQVSPLLLLFGLGVLVALAAGMLLLRVGLPVPLLAAPLMLVFGALAFASVAPLQTFMMRQAPATGAALGATLNISAFNLGNAIGAWLGGLVLQAGFGFAALMPFAALPPLAALAIALTNRKDMK